MGRVKTYYHDQLNTKQPERPEQHMSDEELESYLELLHEEWLARQEAYRYEDNYKPFEVKAKKVQSE